MFGLFKKQTPEEILENDIKQSMEKQIATYIRETGKDEFLMGFAIDSATRDIYNAYMDSANLYAQGHGISYKKTVDIIIKTANEIRNKYLTNPTPIS